MDVHLMPNEKFAKKFIEFIDGYYEENSNFVYVYGFGEKYEHVESQNASYISTFDEVDLSLISDSDKLFIHGFYNTRLIRYLHKIYNQFHNNQLVLIAWGGDIYNDRIYLHEHKFDIITRYGIDIPQRINNGKFRILKQAPKGWKDIWELWEKLEEESEE